LLARSIFFLLLGLGLLLFLLLGGRLILVRLGSGGACGESGGECHEGYL
jgi:hypothetical protein